MLPPRANAVVFGKEKLLLLFKPKKMTIKQAFQIFLEYKES